MSPERNTLEHILDRLAALATLAEAWDHEMKVSEYSHAMGSSSALDDDRVTASREPDEGTFRKVRHPDKLARAYARGLHALEKSLRRTYDRYAYDRNPVAEADEGQRSA